MRLAIFDLDNTLLAGDSDHSWGDFLCQHGHVDASEYQARNDAFYADYCAGKLDVVAYQNFSQAILGRTPMDQLARWHAEFMQEVIEPLILAKGEALLQQHREQGDRLLIITATNRFVTGPIASRLGVDTLLATECGMQDGRYSGTLAGIPCYQEGKVRRLQLWLDEQGMTLCDSYFYSDSRNDLPLLEQVSHPVAVDPDEVLRSTAQARGWPIISLRPS
ncbi:HAD family hydrolase [Pseudomonas sp. N040]|uniref:histidinol-phosphatase n=1 Tax=Pseudomonas sp. N040 TaxID=2785325 RepID=UPI0018A2CA37|nr:HAD family hydrolase [Pseudomonas sp. N040]MBF7730013.1 HAD family hydrolase [Pseudomonas sp. N040]MBW7013655.1 HAD-IB family hydrolase [Pseudomonas sp. N040]